MERWDVGMFGSREKQRRLLEELEVQDDLEVEKLTINERGCWFNALH